MTLTVGQMREYVGTTLSDEAVQRMLDSAYAAINAQVGPSIRIDELYSSGPLLMLNQAATSVVSVTEDLRGDAPIVLSSTDYALRSSGRILERLDSGPNGRSRWYGLVRVEYGSTVTEAERDRVAIELVRFDVTYSPGLSSQSSDSWSESYNVPGQGWDYATGRQAILSTLGRGVVVL